MNCAKIELVDTLGAENLKAACYICNENMVSILAKPETAI